jgi:hypothetical protein
MPSNQLEAIFNCGCCGPECDVCDCEFSDQACAIGELQSTTIPGDPCAGPTVGGTAVPLWLPDVSQRPWVEGEDEARPYGWGGFHITIPCDLMPLGLYSVVVRRARNPSGPSPHIDNDVVLPCEYYFVMYDEDENVSGVYYGYEFCCGRSEAVPTCQTRLSWIRFLEVSAGRGVYDFLLWSPSGNDFVDGFQGNGVLPGECPFSDGPNPCLS